MGKYLTLKTLIAEKLKSHNSIIFLPTHKSPFNIFRLKFRDVFFKKENYILAGPSCDSHDVIYNNKDCILPSKLKCGDKLRILATGAYTTVYSSNFNGMKKISEYFIE